MYRKVPFTLFMFLVLLSGFLTPGATVAQETLLPEEAVEETAQDLAPAPRAGLDTVATQYVFSSSVLTYTEITTGTVHGTASNDDQSFAAIDLGFTFRYNNVDYTQVSIQSNGWIAMGGTIASSYYPLSTGTTNNVISALGRDLQGNGTTSELRSLTEGTAGNHVFTVQWKDYKRYGSSYVGDAFDFQIKLYEATGRVEIVYGDFTVIYVASPPYGPQVGLRGNTNADFNNRTLDASQNWSASVAGTSNTDSMTLTDLVYPANGLTYDWDLAVGVLLDPPSQSGSDCAGSDVVYNLTVFNQTGTAQSFSLTYTTTWPASGPASTGVIPNNASETITVTVHIPWAANAGDSDVLTVTAAGGGYSAQATATTVASLASGWQDYANMPAGREVRAPSVVYHDGKLYVIGGYGYVGGSGAARPWLSIYDIATDSWTTGADMPGARYWIDCEVLEYPAGTHKIYCAGGYLSSAQSTLYIYDIGNDSWSTGASLPAARYNYASAKLDNKYYVIGGYTTTYQNTMLVYDPTTDTWDSTLAPMNVARRYFHAGTIAGQIYVAGGYNGSYLSSAEVYSPTANTWTYVASMPSNWLNGADGVKHDRFLVIAGGHPSSTAGASNGALVYDAQTDTWGWLPLLGHLIYGAEGDIDGNGDFWYVTGRLNEGGVWSNSPYTTRMIQCGPCEPVYGADFSVDPTSPRPTVPATFSGSVAGGSPPIAWAWDFGDGGYGSGQVVQHTYATAGTYTVVMTATNCDGANWVTATHDVLVEAGPLIVVDPLSLESTQCPDSQVTYTLSICNEGDQTLVYTLTEEAGLLLGRQNGIESLSGSFVVFDPSVGGDTCYNTGAPQTFCFRAESFTNDWEYVYNLWQRFPTDWTVNNVYVQGTPYCDSGFWGPFSWSFETSPYEVNIEHLRNQSTTDHCTAYYCFEVVSGSGTPNALESWYWAGDGYGGAPHHPCSSDQYTPAGQNACDEWVNPQAAIPPCGGPGPGIPWLSESPTGGSLPPGQCQDVVVTFDSTGLAPGTYTGTLQVNSNDTQTPQIDVPVTLTVAGPPTNADFTWDPTSVILNDPVTFHGTADALVPIDYTWDFGDGAYGSGQDPTHAYANWGDFTVVMTATACGQTDVATHTLTVLPCWSVLEEHFEGTFPPAGWEVVNNGGTCVWQRNDFWATPRPNYAGGVGYCADADSDKCGSGSTMDTELRTYVLDLSGLTTATLGYMAAYNDIGTGGDLADVDVSADGGSTWTNLLRWDEDHSAYGPGEWVTLNLTPYAGQDDVMVRFHYYVATYDWWWEVDQVNVHGCYVPGAAPDIEVTPDSLYQELYRNQTDEQVLSIANVGLVALDYTLDEGCGTPVDWLALDPLGGTVPAQSDEDVTVSFDSAGLAVGTYTTTICVDSNDPLSPTVVVPVTLVVLETPEIAVDPDSLQATQCPDTVTMQELQICNVGEATLTWSLREMPRTVLAAAWPTIPAPAVERPVITSPDQCAAYENYTGAEPIGAAAFCHPDIVPTPAGGPSPDAPTDIGYALDIGYISDNFVWFYLNDFPGQTVVGLNSVPFYGMDFDPTATILYALNDTTDQLGTISLVDGSFTGLVPCPPGGGAANWTGLTIDPVNGTFYASTATDLYTIDPATGATTLVGPFVNATVMIDIAMNMDGQMYGHDIATDSIYSIDPATGQATLIGPTGYAANYAQGMDFDNDDGTLYIFLYIGSGANVYGTVNLTTGAVTPLAQNNPLGEFEGAVQIPGFTDIPWLSEDPITGTLPAGQCQTVEVTFDSTGLEPADYFADLIIDSNDPVNPQVSVPVTLTVLAPVSNTDFTWSPLEPLVNTPVYFTATASGAEPITYEWAFGDGAYGSGQYVNHAYALAGTYEVILTATNDCGSQVVQHTVTVVGWPDIVVTPESLESTQCADTVATQELQICNQGDVPLTWNLEEATWPLLSVAPRLLHIPAQPATTSPAAKAQAPAQWARWFRFPGGSYPLATYQVLIVSPDSSMGDISLLLNTLAAYPDLVVTVWDNSAGNPTAADMAAYDVVLIGNDYTWESAGLDKAAIGDALADYIDAGGKVIESEFVQSYDQWGFAGRYMTDGYSPFTPATTDYPGITDTMDILEPTHPVMQGVTTVGDTRYQQDPALAAGATLLATWTTTGNNAVAVNDNVVALNLLIFHSADYSGDVGTLLHNAVVWLTPAFDIPWLSEEPTEGTVDAGACQTVVVTFDSTGLAGGTYTGALEITSDDPDLPVVTVPVTLTVEEAAHDADFSWDPPTPLVGEDVTFTGSAAGTEPITYEWSFGDGAYDSGITVTHAYAAAGAYTVTVTATNGCGQDVVQHTVTVVEACVAPDGADFTWTPITPTAGADVDFHGSVTTGTTPLAYAWEFSDGGTGVGQDVTHVFAEPGTYVVTMTVSNECGTDVAVRAVVVEAACEPPSGASFTWSPTTPAVGQMVTFSGSAAGDLPMAYDWDLGDGTLVSGQVVTHTYVATGTYDVRLHVTNACGEDDVTLPVTVVELPQERFYLYLPIIFKNY